MSAKFNHVVSKELTTGLLLLLSVFSFPANSFSQIAAGHGKYLGNIIGGTFFPDFLTYWNQVSPENAGKFGSVGTSQDTSSWNWAPLDTIYNFAVDNDIPFKFHNLVWGQQQPSWISSLDSAQQRQMIETWIRLAGTRYPKTALVDVVNEPLHNPPNGNSGSANYINALGGTGSTGWDWVITVFRWAREYFPHAKLLLNDYGILSSNPSIRGSAVFQYRSLIDTLKARNLIDGIGCESHFLESTPASTIEADLDSLSVTGLPIYISEYDVDEANDSTQLSIYKSQFPVFWTNPDVKGITFWGYVQDHIWRTDAYLIRSDGTERPAMQWLVNYVKTTAVGQSAPNTPAGFTLSQNYPNPFNPTTRIDYTIAKRGFVTLKVYNVLGQEVTTLVAGEKGPGSYTATFNGSSLPSGVYFYKMTAGNFTAVKKLMLVK